VRVSSSLFVGTIAVYQMSGNTSIVVANIFSGHETFLRRFVDPRLGPGHGHELLSRISKGAVFAWASQVFLLANKWNSKLAFSFPIADNHYQLAGIMRKAKNQNFESVREGSLKATRALLVYLWMEHVVGLS
jgi:hypothetical protein